MRGFTENRAGASEGAQARPLRAVLTPPPDYEVVYGNAESGSGRYDLGIPPTRLLPRRSSGSSCSPSKQPRGCADRPGRPRPMGLPQNPCKEPIPSKSVYSAWTE